MAITFRDEKGAPLTHEELDANFRSFFFTASFGANVLLLQRKDGTSLQVPIGGEAFADFQANGGSIGDVYIANSEITGSRMILNLKSGSFYDKTKAPGSDGGSLSSDEWYIHFDPQTSAPYYVHFGSNFAISSSGYLHASGAILEGEITASSGLIGGFNITPDAIHGPTFLGTPSFYISGSASATDHFISASNFSLKGNGDITGSAVLFSGGKIAGWEITNTQIRKSTNVVLDANAGSVTINDNTFGNKGIQLEYNEGTPRFYSGDGTGSFVKFDGTDVAIATRLLEISASDIEISSTEASMSLGGGDIKLLGSDATIEVGSTNKVKLVGTSTDAFIVAGNKTGFASNDAGIIMGTDSTVATLDLTKDASNYFRFNTTSGVDIKTDSFKLDTTYFDIDTSTQRLNIFDTGSKEIIRLGEISDDASDLYGIKVFDGQGTGSANTIAMFGQQGNKIAGWEVTDSQIRTIPAAGFGEQYAEDEVGLVIHSSGKLESSNFATNLKGWRIDTLGNGSAEFENMRIRGTLKTTVFEKESVNVVGGQLMVANSTTIEPLVNESGVVIAGSASYDENAVTFSVANVSGFEEGEILKIKSVDDTGFSVEYLYVSGSKRYSQDSSLVYNTGSIDPDGLFGELYVERAYGGIINVSSSIASLGEDIDDNETSFDVDDASGLVEQSIIKIGEERFKVTSINSNTLTVIRDYHDTVADSHSNGTTVFLIDNDKEFLAGLVSTAKPYNAGQVLVSTGVFNTTKDISSGYILMNANPRDVSTPYMDIVERTGSGVYDLQLRTRLGDLSGLSSAYLYGSDEPGFGLYTENGFFRGAITAQTGSIAGILHVATVAGGLETGQKISIGRDVSGTNDGIYVNNNNYWYTDGAWKVGGSNNFISLDNFTDGNLVISTETFSLDTPNMVISSSLNSGSIAMGVSASAITETAETGIYLDGLGKFRVGTGTSGNNYIYWDGSTLNIKGSVDITGGTGATTAYVDQAESDAVSSAESFTNNATASLAGIVEGVTDTLDGKIFTDSAGRAVRPPTASAEGLYLASTNLGFYKDGEWKTYMDNQGDFFLTGSSGNKLAWDSAAGNLEIKGSITITGGNAATQDFVNSTSASLNTSISASLANVSSSLASDLSGSTFTLTSAVEAAELIANSKAAIFKQATPPTATAIGDMWIETDEGNRVRIWDGTTWATSPDSTFDQTALINATSASLSSSIALDVFTDSSGRLVKTPSTSSAGLYLGDTNLGFYSGSQWKTYMANNGNFYLTGSDSNYLFWDGTSLNIAGSINITGGNATTTADLNAATSSVKDHADSVAATAETNANNFTNSATSSLSGSIAGAINTVSGALAENIQSGSDLNTAISASQALVNEGLQGVIDGKNSIFRQADAPTATAVGDTWIETDEGNRIRIWTGTQWQISSDNTYDQTGLISSTSSSLALDIFTDSTGKIQKPATLSGEGLFMDSTNLGYYSGSEWKTYMANNGNFYLTGSETNYLAWDGTSLTISGNINIVGGNAATQTDVATAATASETYADNAANEASSSLTGSIDNAQETATIASGTATSAAQAAVTASAEALIAQAAAATAISRSVDADGKISFNPTPSGEGLFMNADNLGFYSASEWKTYMSASGDFYLSGDGDNGLSWDGEDLSVDGTIVARGGEIGGITLENNKLYNGTGTHGNSNTGFYIDSSSKFSLGDKLVWDGTNLSIAGSITITNATYATQASLDSATGSLETSISNTAATASAEASAVQGALTSATSSLETSISNTAATASAEASAVQIALNSATGSLETSISNTAATASAEASAAQTAAETTANSALTSATSSLETSISNTAVTASASASAAQTAAQTYTDNNAVANGETGSMLEPYTTNAATSSLTNPSSYSFGGSGFTLDAVPSPSAGLHLGSDKLGYHNGSSWLTYIDSSGNFLLSGSGDDSLSWNGEELRIGNRGVGPTVTYQFSGSLDGNIFDSSITTTETYTTPVLGNRFLNNADGWDEGFHTKAVFDRNDGPTFEWDVVVGHNDPATMVGLFKENPDSFDHDQQHHTFYFQSRDITIRENGSQIDSGLTNDWTSDNDFSENQTYRLRITLLEAGARYEIYRNGDFTAPAFVYTSSTVTDQYVRPGASIHYSNKGIIFRGLAAGAQLGASTKISGNTVQTGKIVSSNHSGTSNGSGMSTAGMAIDLDNGAISAQNFRIASDGSAVFSGTMTIGGTALDATNTLNSGTTATDVGLENVDNVSNSDIQATASAAANSADKDDGTVGGWTIHADKIFTGTDEDVDDYTSAAGRLIVSSSGAIHSKEFYIDKDGNAGFSGNLSAAGGTFSGNLVIGGTSTALTQLNTTSSADIQAGTTKANVGLGNVDNDSTATIRATGSATSGTVGGWTIDSSNIFSGTADSDGYSTDGLTLHSGGSIHAKQFYIDTSGNAFFKGTLSAAGGTFAGSLRVGSTDTAVSTVISGAADGANSVQISGSAADVNIGTTTISGNKIRAGALIANNHSGTSDGSSFSEAGISIDLVNGGISAPKFFVSASGQTQFGGIVNATAGITGSVIKGAEIQGGTLTGGIVNGGSINVPDAIEPQFSVSADGFMTASDAQISGEITATSGQIGDWIIDPITKALRDDNSEIVFSPDPAEIQMFSGTDKKVIIAPSLDLTSTAGGAASISTLGAPSVPSVTSTNYYFPVASTTRGSVSGTITNSTAGGKEVTLVVPTWQVEDTAGAAQTVTVAEPDYLGTYENQKHGFSAATRKRNTATITLEAVAASNTNTILGSTQIGVSTTTAGHAAYTYYNASGSDASEDDGPFLEGITSVTGDTEITLADGSTKVAKNITEEDLFKVYDWVDNNNVIVSGSISKVVSTNVNHYYRVKTDSTEVKVSDTHGFWIDDNKEIKVTSLVPRESKVYIIQNETIVLETVKEVELIREPIEVFTFKVPKYNNYISNNILSHNPSYGRNYVWEQVSAPLKSAFSTYSGLSAGSKTVNINVASGVDFKLRYAVTFTAQAGNNKTYSAGGSAAVTTTTHTNNAYHPAISPTFDGTVEVTVPTNFVEIKAGGIQIVSDATQYVRMPRLAQGSSSSSTIFQAKGGTVVTDALKPSSNGGHNLGTSNRRWNYIYSEGGSFSGAVATGALTVTGAITATGNITAFNSSDKRLKSNIVTLDGALEKVLKLRGTSFDWKEGKEDIHPYKGNDIGFIAQELKEVVPEVVGKMHGGFYGVKYDKLTPLLVEAIKELKTEIDLLKSNSCNCKCKK